VEGRPGLSKAFKVLNDVNFAFLRGFGQNGVTFSFRLIKLKFLLWKLSKRPLGDNNSGTRLSHACTGKHSCANNQSL